MYFETDFKVRSNEEEGKYLEGYFIRYNAETELQKGIYEEISPSAIVDSLKNSDVRCLFNHDSSVVLGRTGNGTLELRSDEKGLWGKVQINENDKQATDIYARIERGDINACSFGFIPLDEEIEHRDDGSAKFIVRKADLLEVSAVTFPAYPQTMVAARQKDAEQSKQRSMQAKKELLRRKLNGFKTINAGKED